MKPRPWLVISAVANFGLLVWLIVVLSQAKTRSPQVITKYVTNDAVRIIARPLSVPASTNQPGLQKVWQSVESADYATYINNLRALGCPEETIRDIIIADINKLYGQRLRALDPNARQTNAWWTSPAYDYAGQREYARQSRALNREKRELVKTLLGVDLNQEIQRQQGYPYYQSQQLAFLPEEKRAQIQAITEKYSELEAELYDRSEAELPQAQKWAQAKILREQRKAEIAALLTPAELEDYELRTSTTAMTLRYNMSGFDGTEQEYRAIFRLQKAFDEQYSAYDPYDRDGAAKIMQERQAAQKKLDEDLKAALGAERFTEYKRAQDYNYRSIYDITRRYQLPKETAISVYELKQTAEEQKRQISASKEWSQEQRTAALGTLKETTDQAVRNALGPNAFKDYQQRGGYWIQNLGR